MNLRKNNVSYLAWVILLFFTGASCAFFGLIIGQIMNMNVILAAGSLVTLFFAVIFGLYLLIGYLLERKEQKPGWLQMLDLSVRLERVFFYSLILIGFVLRILLIDNAGEEAAYYDVCKVVGVEGIPIKSVQGSVYIYCVILHGLFRIIGNRWIAGIWLQIVLQLIGAMIFTKGLRRVLDKVPAYAVLAYILFSPAGIKAGLYYSPQMLYFVFFSTAFYFLADYLIKSREIEENPAKMWLYTFWISVLIGICAYLDISGFILLCFWLVLPMVKRKEYTGIWNIRMIVGVIVSLLVVLLFVLLDAVLSSTSVIDILSAWFTIYGDFYLNYDLLVSKLTIDYILLIVLACIGCFSFWRRANTERFTPYILMAVAMGVFVFSGMTTENMSGTYLLCVLLAVLASVSVTELFCSEDLVKVTVKKSKETEEVDDSTIKPIEYIENPLPVPKKHVRKTMDYAFIPDESQMKYDIHVSDKDDYDIKM